MMDWENIAERLLGASVNLKPLAGEYDLNFLAALGTHSCILKVMRPDCEMSFVDMQIKAIMHLRKSDKSLPIPDAVLLRWRIIALSGRNLGLREVRWRL